MYSPSSREIYSELSGDAERPARPRDFSMEFRTVAGRSTEAACPWPRASNSTQSTAASSPAPLEACQQRSTRASSQALVRDEINDYSVPTDSFWNGSIGTAFLWLSGHTSGHAAVFGNVQRSNDGDWWSV